MDTSSDLPARAARAGRSPGRCAPRRAAALVGALALAAALAACTSSGSSAASGRAASGQVASGAAGSGAVAGSGTAGAAPVVAATARQVVTTASAQLRSDDVARAVARVADAADTAGGRVQSRSQAGDPGASGGGDAAHLVLRVPSASLTPFLDSLDDLGTLTRVSVSSRDVTATSVDLAARISALQSSTARLQHLLDTASSTADLVAAESALTDRQAQLESLQAQARVLSGQVDLATLTLSVVPRGGAAAVDDRGGFTGGLAHGWRALVATAAVLLVVVGAALPWLLVAAVVVAGGLGLRAAGRRLRRRGAVTGPPPA